MLTAIIRRNWQMYVRYFPITLFFKRILDIGFKLLGLWLVSNFLFDNKIQVNNVIEYRDYFSYAAIGLIFYNVSIAILMNVGRALITEVREGTLESTLVSPYSIVKYYFGIFFEQLGRTFLEFLSSYSIAFFLGANLQSISLLNLIICFLYVSLISFSMGTLLSNIMLWFRDTFITQNTLFLIIFLVSGITFPKELLPSFLQKISKMIPLSHSLDAIRNLFFNTSHFNIYNFDFLQGILISVVYFIVGLLVYKKIEQKIVSYISD